MSSDVLFFEYRKSRDHGVCILHICVVVDAPVRLSHLPGGVKEAGPDIVHDKGSAYGHADALNGLHDSVNDVRAGFEEIGPEEVEQMDHGVFAV